MNLSPLRHNTLSHYDAARFETRSHREPHQEHKHLNIFDFLDSFAQLIAEKHDGAQLIGVDLPQGDSERGTRILVRIMRTNSTRCGLIFETVAEDLSDVLKRAFSPSAPTRV